MSTPIRHFTRALLTFFCAICLLSANRLQAQIELAIAHPRSDLTVDGDLYDWSDDLPRYPLARIASGSAPDDHRDLAAQFSIAYHPETLLLFIALEVEDQSTVVDHSATAAWNTQDGCEINFNAGGTNGQYALWGDQIMGAEAEVDLAYSRIGNLHRYEWSIDTRGQGITPAVGALFHMDLAVNDRDRDGSFTALKWGTTAAQVVLLPPEGDVGNLQGKVRWASSAVVPRAAIAMQSTVRDHWQWVVRADRTGRFALTLPQGPYRLITAADTSLHQLDDELTVDLKIPRQTAISVPLGPGTTTAAGPGGTIEASFGIQKDLWRTYGLPDGLPSTVVDAIYQDRSGYLWFGTQGGVSRYDGTHFTTFTVNDGLSYNGVSAIAEDANGHLWFATWGGGVSRYDGETFTTYTTADGLANDVVLAIGKDRAGTLWFGTQGGISHYDGTHFTTFNTQHGLAHDEISAIAEDGKGYLWFATWGGGVSRYDGTDFATFTSEDGLAHDEISAIAKDANGHLWFATQGGVSRYDGTDFTSLTSKDGLAHDAVSSIALDRQGDLWFGTWERGVSRYDGTDFTTFTNEDGLAHDEVSRITPDSDGHLWFGTWGGGISRYDGVNFKHFKARDGLAHNTVSALLEDRSGRIWIGTQDGLNLFKDQRFTTFTTADGLTHNAITALAEDSSGRIWIGTQDGLSLFKGDIKAEDPPFAGFTVDDGLAHNWVNCIVVDPGGALWLGTWGGGLSHYDKGKFTTYTSDDGLAHDWINTGLVDADGTLWLGTKGGGLSRYDEGKFTTYTSNDGLAANWIWAMVADGEGTLWLGTDNGVSRFDGKDFSTLTSKDGLSSDKISALLQDPADRLWIGTQGGGITLYNGTVLQNMLVRDGLTDNTINALMQDAQGRVWIGTDRGATLLRPSIDPAPIHLSNVVADRRYGAVDAIALSAAQDYLAFEFQGVSFKTRPGALVYRYRLTGHDENWQQSNLDRVEYHDLPIGDYTFEVGAIDRDLALSSKPISVQVRVHPPYGDIALYSALFVVVLGLLWAVGQIIQRNRRLEVSRREAEEARQEADDANEAKSTFLANMSHEIRTPMNGIVGMVDMMRRTGLEKNQRNYLSVIDTSADALLELINDILDLSKIEAGSMELEETDFVLWEVLEGVLKLMAMRAHEKGLELACCVDPDVPEGLVGDPTRLRQVVVNLIGNAIKFTAEGEVVIEVQCRERTADRVELHIGVRDTGIGIPKDKQDLIFEAFAQADSSTTRQFGGTGLGLNISRQLVELMQGRIWLESEEGQGSTFQFTAAFALSDLRANDMAAEPWRQLPAVRILIAVTNSTNQSILTDILRQWSFETVACSTGAQALDALQQAADAQQPFDMAFIDSHLSDTTGLELVEGMSPQPGLEIVLLLSSLEDQDFIDRAVAAGIQQQLRKPLTPSDLLDAVITARGAEVGLTSRATATEEAERLPPLAILLADDNPTNQYVATSMLEDAGHRVVTADDGRQVLARLADEAFDLILMDVQMPEMDGYEATGAIREQEQATGAHMPIIGLTANAMKGDREACIAAGMDEYVPKPVRWEVLRQTIAKLGVEGGILPADYGQDRLQAAADEQSETAVEPVEEVPADTVLDLHALDNLRSMESRGAISVAKMIALFYDSGAQLIPALRESLATADSPVLTRQAHTLKGSAGYLGARKLATLCQELESKGKAEDLVGADESIEAIEAAFLEVKAAIAEQVPEAAQQEPEPEREETWSPNTLDPATREKLPELLGALESEMLRWEDLYKNMTITEIETLGTTLVGLGEDYTYPPLTSWAQQVQSQAQNFDIEGLQASYEAYPELVQNMQALIES